MIKQLVKSLIPRKIFNKIVPAWHLGVAVMVSARYGFPARKLRFIGVTGTNGKTTTSFMIHSMLTKSGVKSGLLSTVANGVGDDITPQLVHMTTLSAPELQRKLRDFSRENVQWVVLETTSHSLAQHRVWGIPFEMAVLTNVTHEHLDYHGSFESYKKAKQKLFTITGKHKNGWAIVNAEDSAGKDYLQSTGQGESYGLETGDIVARNLKLSPDSSQYTATIGDVTYDIICPLPGKFNVSNSLAAVCVGRRIGLTKEQIETGVSQFKGVEGRMTTIDENQLFSAIVDFAHTPDSFEKLLGDMRESTKGKLVVMFGSAGRRDEAKRALQGEIAGRICDEVVVTEEDDRDDDGMKILQQIAEGARKAGKVEGEDLFLKHDREEAIKFSLSRVGKHGDAVLFLGKGHEKMIERADGEHPWDEAGLVRKYLRMHQ